MSHPIPAPCWPRGGLLLLLSSGSAPLCRSSRTPNLELPMKPDTVVERLRNKRDPLRGNYCPPMSTRSNDQCRLDAAVVVGLGAALGCRWPSCTGHFPQAPVSPSSAYLAVDDPVELQCVRRECFAHPAIQRARCVFASFCSALDSVSVLPLRHRATSSATSTSA